MEETERDRESGNAALHEEFADILQFLHPTPYDPPPASRAADLLGWRQLKGGIQRAAFPMFTVLTPSRANAERALFLLQVLGEAAGQAPSEAFGRDYSLGRLYRAVELFWALAVLVRRDGDAGALAGVLNQDRFVEFWEKSGGSAAKSFCFPAENDPVWISKGYGLIAHYRSSLAGWQIISLGRGELPRVRSGIEKTEKSDFPFGDRSYIAKKFIGWTKENPTVSRTVLKNTLAEAGSLDAEKRMEAILKFWVPCCFKTSNVPSNEFFRVLWGMLKRHFADAETLDAFVQELDSQPGVESDFSAGEKLRIWAAHHLDEIADKRSRALMTDFLTAFRRIELVTCLTDFLLEAMVLAAENSAENSSESRADSRGARGVTTRRLAAEWSGWLTQVRMSLQGYLCDGDGSCASGTSAETQPSESQDRRAREFMKRALDINAWMSMTNMTNVTNVTSMTNVARSANPLANSPQSLHSGVESDKNQALGDFHKLNACKF